MRSLVLACAAGVALGGCAGMSTGPREAERGALLVMIDHSSGRALAPEADAPLGPEGFTELRFLGLSGQSVYLLKTVHEPNPTIASGAPDAPAPEALPRVSTSFAVDMERDRKIAVRGHVVAVESARPDCLRYRVRRVGGA